MALKAAIMQPYFFPYIGYFQLIKAVDLFVVYDNIKYTKKGWINRNRFLQHGQPDVFSLPLKKDSDSLDVKDRMISPDFKKEKLLNKLRAAYRAAPFFDPAFSVFERVLRSEEENLFEFIHQSIKEICGYLGIKSEIRASSTVAINHVLKSQEKVLAICKNVGADVYINPVGGEDLYAKDVFKAQGIDLRFLKAKDIAYPQFGTPFVPRLSILDVMMFNSQDAIDRFLSHGYDLR